jgi:hypothetical protein
LRTSAGLTSVPIAVAIARSRSCWTWLLGALLMLLCAQFGAGTGGVADPPELPGEQRVEPLDADADDSDDDPSAIAAVGGHGGLHVRTPHASNDHGLREQAGHGSTVERPPDVAA